MLDTRSLTTGFNHVAVITRDLDRSAEFWCAVLDASFRELPEGHGRHGFITLDADGSSVLHVFEVPESYTGPHPSGPIMQRGRIDHLAIAAADERALVEIRDRLVARKSSSGSIQLFGSYLLSVHGIDPDGKEYEVACARTGELLSDDDYVAAD